MFSGLRKVDLANFTDGLPVLMMVMITLIANSFGTGIAGGLLFYIVIKAIAGKWRDIPVGLWILAIPGVLLRHAGEALTLTPLFLRGIAVIEMAIPRAVIQRRRFHDIIENGTVHLHPICCRRFTQFSVSFTLVLPKRATSNVVAATLAISTASVTASTGGVSTITTS